MKKVFYITGGSILLFLFAFYSSYSIYKRSRSCNDKIPGQSGADEYIWTVDEYTSEEAAAESLNETDTSAGRDMIETLSNKEHTEEISEESEAYHFLVSELNGYVAVFTESGSLYEFTDIRMDELENTIQKRIENGIKFQKAKELFTFLESCSS